MSSSYSLLESRLWASCASICLQHCANDDIKLPVTSVDMKAIVSYLASQGLPLHQQCTAANLIAPYSS